MRKLIVVIAGLLFLSGCASSTKRYDVAIANGLSAVEAKKYEEALSEFDKAIEEKKEDSLAKANRKQAFDLVEASKFVEDNKLEEASEAFDKVINERLGSPKIASHAREEKEKSIFKKPQEETNEGKEKVNDLWNAQKEEALHQFMISWGASMEQTYKSYTPTSNVDFYGLSLPEETLSGSWQTAVNENPVEVIWSDVEVGEKAFQLVAVYSDAETQPYLKKHVYYFMIENGVPKVFVTQQNQGNEMNYLYFTETENEALKQNFSTIVLAQ